MEKQNYIGRKVKGFSFDYTESCTYVEEMNKYINKIGRIKYYHRINDSFEVEFNDDFWNYPASLIDQYLVPEEQDEA